MKKTKTGILLGIILFTMAYVVINYTQAEEYKAEPITVKAEVKLDCTIETHIYEEECIIRLALPMARSRAFFEAARNNRIESQRIEDEAFEMMNADIERYNTVYGVTVD